MPGEASVALLVVVGSEEPGSDSAAVEEDPVPERLPMPLLPRVVELPRG